MIPTNIGPIIPTPQYFNLPNFLPIQMLMYPDSSPESTHDNQSKKFSGTDSPELFKQNLKTQSLDWHYRTKEIIYNVNSSGYRAPEWKDVDWNAAVVVFGCSNVAGIGVAEDETVTYYLGQLLNRPVINLGAPGSSIEFSVYNSAILAESYPVPYAVIQIWSGVDRCTHFSKDLAWHCGPWDTKHHYFKSYVKNDTHSLVRAKFLEMISRNLWKGKTKYYSASYFNKVAHYTNSEYLEIDNDARDLLHPGRHCNLKMAELIAANIN
jgi:hypothetical protein